MNNIILRSLFIFIFLFIFKIQCFSQKLYIALNPQDCVSCINTLSNVLKEDKVVFVLQETYKYDSTKIKQNLLNNYKSTVIYSDVLFSKYSINSSSTISNQQATIQFPIWTFNAYKYAFLQRMDTPKSLDTFTYEIPFLSSSVKQRIYTKEGMVYLLNNFSNDIKLFDLTNDTLLEQILLDDSFTKEAYTDFFEGKIDYVNQMKHFKEMSITDNAVVNSMSFNNGILSIASLNNYYFINHYFPQIKSDTLLNKFIAIQQFVQGKATRYFVPMNFRQRYEDTSQKYAVSRRNIYEYKDAFYLPAINPNPDTIHSMAFLGLFNIDTRSFLKVYYLPKEYKNYGFGDALFSENYYVVLGVPTIFDLNSASKVETNLFPFDNDPYGKPNYIFSFKSDDQFFYLLYFISTENKTYYAKIKKTDHSIQKKVITGTDIFEINPYNYNCLDRKINDFSFVKTLVFEE